MASSMPRHSAAGVTVLKSSEEKDQAEEGGAAAAAPAPAPAPVAAAPAPRERSSPFPKKTNNNAVYNKYDRNSNRTPETDRPTMNDVLVRTGPKEVRVVLSKGEDGDEMMGVMNTKDALAKARELGKSPLDGLTFVVHSAFKAAGRMPYTRKVLVEHKSIVIVLFICLGRRGIIFDLCVCLLTIPDMDLIMISETAVPPVCKIIDYGKFKYSMEKKKKEQKKKAKTTEVKEVKMSYKIETHDYGVRMRQMLKFLEDGDKVRYRTHANMSMTTCSGHSDLITPGCCLESGGLTHFGAVARLFCGTGEGDGAVPWA